MAGVTYQNELWVLDGNGTEVVKGKTPYSLFRRRAYEYKHFATVSWHADGTRIAIGAYDHIWIYRLDRNAFEPLPLRDDEDLMSQGASALYVPNSDDLVVMQRWTVWRVSAVTGQDGRAAQHGGRLDPSYMKDLTRRMSPGSLIGRDEAHLEAAVRRWRLSYGSPGAVGAFRRMNLEIDVRAILPTIRVPTLVVQRRDERFVPREVAQYVADESRAQSTRSCPARTGPHGTATRRRWRRRWNGSSPA